MKQSDGRYLVEISDLSAHELGDMHTVTVTTESGSFDIKVSALSYVYGVLSRENDAKADKDLATAIYRYYAAAMAYKSASS